MPDPVIGPVYLAGPMTGLPDYNAPAFAQAAADLRARGIDVINPLEEDAKLDGFDPTQDTAQPHRHYMARDLGYITGHAQAVVVLDGWEDSRGARLEVHTAVVCGLPVLRYPSLSPVQVHVQAHGVPGWARMDMTQRRPTGDVFTGPADVTSVTVQASVEFDQDGRITREDYRVVDQEPAPVEEPAGFPPDVVTSPSVPPGFMAVVDQGTADRIRAAEEAFGSPDCPCHACTAARAADPLGAGGEQVDAAARRVLGLLPDEDGSGRRIVEDPTTGGRKETRLERPDLIPAGPLKAIARHFGIGCEKYEARNWERGYSWSLSYGALQRHLLAWWDGEDEDVVDLPDGRTYTTPHLAAAAFHVLALMEFAWTHPELDDRPASLARDVARAEWMAVLGAEDAAA